MLPKNEFQHFICLPFCAFYKPGNQEELFCRGAWLVDRLVRRRRLTPADFLGLGKDHPWPPGGTTDLEAAVCADCPFRAADCDFKDLNPPEDARPCGGLVLLRQLLAAGKIALEDLAEAD